MARYMLAREGIQPNHGEMRGPIAPVNDPNYPKGGTLGYGKPGEFAQWKVIHDAGAAFVVWVSGSDEWETGYVDTLAESVSAETFDVFLVKLAESVLLVDGSVRARLAATVLDSLRLDPMAVVAAPMNSTDESFIKEGAVTAPENPASEILYEAGSTAKGGLVVRFPDAGEIASQKLDPSVLDLAALGIEP